MPQRSIIFVICKFYINIPKTPRSKPISSSQPLFRRNKWRLSCWKAHPPPSSAALVPIFQNPLALLPIKAFNSPFQDFSRMAFSQIKRLPLLRLDDLDEALPLIFSNVYHEATFSILHTCMH